MWKKNKWLTVAALCALPLMSYADITLINNTDYYGTGRLNSSPCSSLAGDRGVAKPHESLQIPQSVINLFCSKTGACDAHIFMTQDCSGDEVATASIDRASGTITKIQNRDSKHFVFTNEGSKVTVDPAPKGFKAWFNW